MSPRDPRAAPKPPDELMDEMAAAHDDPARLAAAKSRYRAWLTDQGWHEPTPNVEQLGWYAEHERREDDR